MYERDKYKCIFKYKRDLCMFFMTFEFEYQFESSTNTLFNVNILRNNQIKS